MRKKENPKTSRKPISLNCGEFPYVITVRYFSIRRTSKYRISKEKSIYPVNTRCCFDVVSTFFLTLWTSKQRRVLNE